MTDTKVLEGDAKQPSGPQRNIPTVRRVVRLTHKAAQHVYARAYGIDNRALYQMETMPRPPSVGILAARLEHAIDERFAVLKQDLDEAVQCARRMLADNGIVWDGKCNEGVAIEAPVSARRSVAYLGLLEQFDILAGSLDVAQSNGLLTQKGCREEIYRWQRRLTHAALSLAGTIHEQAGAWPKRGKARRRPR